MPRIYLSPPHMGPAERSLLLDAFDSNWIAPLGPHVDAFEREFAARVGVAHAAALSSGTAALHLALLILDVEPGDTVFTSTLTFAATANAIHYTGARPVFIDCDREDWIARARFLATQARDPAPHYQHSSIGYNYRMSNLLAAIGRGQLQ